jgi:hypothetical protein
MNTPINTVILTFDDVREQIRKAVTPLGAAAEKGLRELIEASVQIVRQINRQRWFEELEAAKAKTELARSRFEETRRQLGAVREDLSRMEPARMLKTLVCLLCWAICMAGEFAITWSTIPFVLNVPENGVLGIAVSAVVVAMLTVMEWVLARALEEPYQKVTQSAGSSARWSRFTVRAMMASFLLLLLLGNLYTVRLLADAREESIKLRQNLERDNGDDAIAVDRGVINRAIGAISVAVVVDGAVLFLMVLGDVRNIDRRLRARHRARVYEGRLPAQEEAYLRARATEAVHQQVWDEREERADSIAADYRNRCLVELQAVLDQKVPEPRPLTTEELVEAALARGAVGRRSLAEAA